jgi:pimeloyl-ACP methyl ester carboxylesterase
MLKCGRPKAHGSIENIPVATNGSRGSKLKSILAIGASAVGAAAAVNAVIAATTPPATGTLGGVFSRYPFRYGDIAYTVAGSGSPVLLLHGIGAGNSMAEWKENFEALRAQYTVYALDFMGWGLSDKPEHQYEPEDMIEQIEFFANDVIGESCAVIASSDACAYAIEAAQRRPDLFTKLVLVCPPSASERMVKTAPLQTARHLAQRVFSVPVLGQSLFNFFASRKAVESFARRHLYFDKERVTDRVVSGYYSSAHQPGAVYGFASFVSGTMVHDARTAWDSLEQPALLVWGRNALINPLETAPEWLAIKPDARLEVIDNSMLLPHVEHPEAWNRLILKWLG